MLTIIIILPIITLFIYSSFNTKFINKVIFLCLSIILNNLRVKFYSDGSHDQVGQFLINSSSIISAFFAYIVLLIFTVANSKTSDLYKERCISTTTIPFNTVSLFALTWDVGLGLHIESFYDVF